MGKMWYRTSHRWTQSSSATIFDSQGNNTILFSNFNFEVCVKTKTLYVNFTAN